MKLIFEKSAPGRRCDILPECDVPKAALPEGMLRASQPRLPQLSIVEIDRHYTQLSYRAHGVNSGFYPLGSCTMKYNPSINEDMAALPGFTGVHPLQPQEHVQGCLEVLCKAEQYLCEITGMDAMTFQPAAGAHGELTGLLLIKAYHKSRGDTRRKKMIIPDSAHGTNPASASMVGYQVVNIPSKENGCVDMEKLREAVDDETAGLMLTNPNTVGLFETDILEITEIVHNAGGLIYYDGANLNAIMGIARPGDMGFDVVHLNLHKTFSTPHGGGGPGSGPVGCKELLKPFLPSPHAVKTENGYVLQTPSQSIGMVRSFYGNFLVVVRALTYIMTLGREGIPQAAQAAVLNANYLMHLLKEKFDVAYDTPCMHEFVLTLESLKKETGVSALDVAKAVLDYDMYPPTMYFPLIVHEALMFEPTETESKETLDEVAAVYLEVYEKAFRDPQALHDAPLSTPVRRLDEVTAARNPILHYQFSQEGTPGA